MDFLVQEKNAHLQIKKDMVLLRFVDKVDFMFRTQFDVSYYDEQGLERVLGPVKIGMRSMGSSGSILKYIPKQFRALDETFFSLGQDEAYYSNLKELGTEKRVTILKALRDIAYDRKHFDNCKNLAVMQRSILRNISAFSASGRLRRMAGGDMRLAQYSFSYELPHVQGMPPTKLDFEVIPESNPATNIHVLIGRNGTGKTRLLKSMISSITTGDTSGGSFSYKRNRTNTETAEFANILCVAFSPFDDFSSLGTDDPRIPWSFIGLNMQRSKQDERQLEHDEHRSKQNNCFLDLKASIEKGFCDALLSCMEVAWKQKLWTESISILKSDRGFQEEEIERFAAYASDQDLDLPGKEQLIKSEFSRLSSGHKVVLLIITGCVDKIEEKSIVFIDEPENHLHPPLLSALIRSLSELLKKRNGVAIISTHSPVVLQEVPRKCVWVLNKYGDYRKAEHPTIKTFGASIGSLTNDVFGLEVSNSGFHKLLWDAVTQLEKERQEKKEPFQESAAQWKKRSYDRISTLFDRQLGDEADLLLWTMLSLQEG